ncbi:con-Ins Im2-like [Patella vulgata]|uniref:con-Ins Im2-like n=1 Tax=Patella vulgata TaxID=6465 RepID=UPI00217F5101|nr:con-Ins Im2-like [Patella vulgata]
MCLLIMVIIMTIYRFPASADLERFCNLEKTHEGPHPNGFCGDGLDQVLRLVCGSPFKRSSPSGGIETLVKRSLRNKPVTLDKFNALSFLKRSGFGRQGITCECCNHKCNIIELGQYCNALP